MVVVAVDTAGVVVEKTVVVVAVVVADSNFSDRPEIVSYCLEKPPDHSQPIS